MIYSMELHCSLKINHGLFDRFKVDLALVSPSAVHMVAEWLAAGDHETSLTGKEKKICDLLRQVSHIMSCVLG